MVLVIFPKVGDPTNVFGPWKCGWLKVLNDSVRNSRCIPSRSLSNRNSLKTDMETYLAPGWRTLLMVLGAVPNAKSSLNAVMLPVAGSTVGGTCDNAPGFAK